MSCEWREKVGLYVDDELDSAAQQELAVHLHDCAECASAMAEQTEFKKSLRLAGKRYTAPPQVRAAIYKELHAGESVSRWWKWGFGAACAALLVALGFLLTSRPRTENPVVAELVDHHIISSASGHSLDVLSSDKHTVKPWFQGKIPFTFNLPDLNDSPYTLLGGNLVYAQQSPGAELVYQVRQHRISVFIFQAHNEKAAPLQRNFSFTVKDWTQAGLQYYLVTDAAPDEASRLVSMFQQTNR